MALRIKKNEIIKVKGYERKGPVINVEDVFKVMGSSKTARFNEEIVNLNSQRLKVFKKMGVKCKCCALVGIFFAVERHQGSNSKYHLNLYGLDKNKEVLMTKDHIIPKSLGGKNSMDNYQTMCAPCNSKKANLIDFPIE